VNTLRFNRNHQTDHHPVSAVRPWAAALKEKHQNGEILNSIGHFFTVGLLTEELKRLNSESATGTDGVTCKDFRRVAPTEIPILVDQIRSRRYKCQPNRRATILKADGSPRHLGIPCMRDKLVGAGIKAILEPICEGMFSEHSYAYRPGRGCHHALADLGSRIALMQGGFILDLDVEKFFDRVSHNHLMDFVREMVSDPIILHAIHEFIVAGTLIQGGSRGQMHFERTGQGTPQGGVISPLLANIYLHHVFDTYVTRVLSPSIPGGVSFVRYADDMICLVRDAESAIRVRESLDQRFGTYGISLHPYKSRTLDFRRPDRAVGDTGFEKTGFNFLGFRVEWNLTPSGGWKLSMKIASGRIQKGVARTRDVWMKNPGLYTSKIHLLESLHRRITGFGRYFRFEECSEGVQAYGSELGKLAENFGLKDDSVLLGVDPRSSNYLPLKSQAGRGAAHA